MRILVGAIVAAIVGAAMAGWLIARTSSPPAGPVILISIDSLRADRLGAYGYRRAATPNLDALAAAGVVFERAYSHAPLTLPAHLSILSGRLPIETGVRSDEGAVLPPKLPLLPALLHRRGFKTAGILSSPLLGRQTGLASAFDFFDDEVPQRSPDAAPESMHRDGAATIEVAKRWVQQQGTRFFLFLQLDEPRAPYAPPARFAKGDPYDGEVAQVDALVGNFVQFLKSRDLYDRALIVLLADHGEALGDHGETGHGLFLYDSTLRTPLVVKMPRDERGGRRRSEVVQHVDVLPTILDLMGAPRPSGVRGRSLRHLLDSDDATLPAAPVYSESLDAHRRFGWSELTSVTDGRYRYIRAPRPELYDLLQDRGERTNIAESDPAKLAELARVLDKFLAAAPPPAASPLNEEDRQALLALVGPAATASTLAAPAAPAAVAGAGSVQAPPPAARDPKDGLALAGKLLAAHALAAEGRLADAAARYREVVAADGENREAWRAMGRVLLAGAQPKEALEAYRQAIHLNVEDVDAILGAARALALLGKYDDAERHAALAAKLDPLRSNEALVRIELRQKDVLGAQRAAEAARQADPASPMVAFAAGVELYQARKYEEAVPRLEEAVQQAAARPVQTPDVNFYAGEALAHVRRYSDAEARLTEELRWFPDNVRAREALASVYQQTGRAAEVPALVAELVRAIPTPDGYAAASRIAASLGDKAAASGYRTEGRRLFGDAAVRAAEQGPR